MKPSVTSVFQGHGAAERQDANELHKPLVLHDIRAIKPYSLYSFIEQQATLHDVRIDLEPERLKTLMERIPGIFQGFALYAGGIPAAYCVFYPSLDAKGDKGIYIEDFFITQPNRGYGLIKLIFQELARRAKQQGCTHIIWSTDNRNIPVRDFNNRLLQMRGDDYYQRVGAGEPPTVTFDAGALLRDRKNCGPEGYETRALEPGEDLSAFNLGKNAFQGTETWPFRGFITFRDGEPCALTAGCIGISTFGADERIQLETPQCRSGDCGDIVSSIAFAAAGFRNQAGYDSLKWHVDAESPFARTLHERALPVDSMLGTYASRLGVYAINRKVIDRLARDIPQSENRIKVDGQWVLVVPADDSLGVERGTPRAALLNSRLNGGAPGCNTPIPLRRVPG